MESTDASIFYPQRKDIVEKYGDQYGTDADKMVYNGPFTVDEWTHNSSIKLAKNDEYWDKENVDLGAVNYQIISDTSAITNAYDSGQIDFISASSQEDLQKYEGDDNNTYTKTSGDKLLSNSIIQKMKSFQIRKSEKHLHLQLIMMI